MRFTLLPGNRYDTVGVAPLIEGMTFGALVADKAFDVAWIIAEAEARNATICIPTRKNRVQPRAHDPEVYKARHLIENFFCRLKEFRRIALRTDKTDTSFTAIIQVCAALINTTLNLNRP